MRNFLKITLTLILTLGLTQFSSAQGRKKKNQEVPAVTVDKATYNTLKYRNIGPFRGGRSAAVTGVAGKPQLFYFGSTGGGVWRTQDGGSTFENISDGYFGGSVGSVAVSEWDNNVIYVGGGEKTVRGNVSSGYGIFKSVDAGETWEFKGLPDSRHISRLRIHPKNPDLVYAAVMGDLYKSSEERGVYRSKDGGNTWEGILFANSDAGAVDLLMDPTNPRILYASTWRIRRTPYDLSSGGEGSSLWKSKDGGDTWTELSKNQGFPEGTLGIIGVAVSPLNNQRVWAQVEANEGGLFRSDDGGKNWKQVNSDRSLRQRAWYYTRVYADTKDENTVYVLNVRYHKSTDGGQTFKSANAPHGDHHDLWIAPEDPQRMIIGDDGGAQVTYDGGENWSTYHNQPTSQFYRVTTDKHFPFRIYGAQQDNSAIRIAHRTSGAFITESDWESTAGGESAHLAVDPKNNDIVYGGSYGGYLSRYNHKTQENRVINVWPDNPMGHGVEDMKYRFQWNFPVMFSQHDQNKLYVASNRLHVTTDEGQSWEVISPDLTRNDSTKMGTSGGPITKDNTGVEYYCTIFAVAESPLTAGEIWAGSDDGLLHITRDGGKNWENITPPTMPEWTMINAIDVSKHKKGTAYIAGTRYKLGDFAPYLYKTTDYGKTWTKITKGIKKEHFTRVIRADVETPGLLYAGTETGMYISYDDGANWESFQLNLPIVPITDLAVKDEFLIVATQGRSFWIIDDLTLLRQAFADVKNQDIHLYKPKPTYLMGGYQAKPNRTMGQNHASGVVVNYFLKSKPDSNEVVKLRFLDAKGEEIVTYATDSKDYKLEAKDSTNQFNWNMRYKGAEKFDGMILWWAGLQGPQATPGKYWVELVVGDDSTKQEFELLPDPRSEATPEDYVAQFSFLKSVVEKVDETHKAIKAMRSYTSAINDLVASMPKDSALNAVKDSAKAITKDLSAIEKTLYQTKNRSGQDPLNFPIRLNNKLAHLNSIGTVGNFKPTDQMVTFKNEVTEKIDAALEKFHTIEEERIPAFNTLVKASPIEPVPIKKSND
jgi:photosystem II stability/assembly factor-like uncharacterized protein